MLLSAEAAHLRPLDQRGYSELLASRRGKVVVVDFWATWCDPCREEMPALIALQKKLGFELVTVSADEPEQEPAALQFLASVSAPEPWWIKRPLNDENFINSVDPKWTGALPGVFLYDRAGKRRESLVGEPEAGALEKAIRGIMDTSH